MSAAKYKVGQEVVSDSGRVIGECEHGCQRWHCETCKVRAVADRLESRVATLEAALREIDRNGPPTESLSDFADKYTSDNMGDVFDAGVSCGAASAGAIAREALEAKP